jgi:excisionase family DNA binding protein
VTEKDVDPEKYYQPQHVAPLFGVTHDSIIRWIERGDLPALRLPTRFYRIKGADVLALLATCRTVQEPQTTETEKQRIARGEKARREMLASR